MTERTDPSGQPIGEPVPGWTARPRPPRTPMVGRTCRIVPVDPTHHAEALFDAFAVDRAGRDWTYLPYGPFADAAGLRAWMESACLGEDPLFHTVLDGPTGRPVGLASYLRIEPAVGVIEVGHIHYAPSMQRGIAATEAMVLMTTRVFDELGYRRYEWKCDALNAPSRRAADRLGFRFEGVFRQATIYKGRNRDTAWYAVIDKEWPRLRAAFERWLDPVNFDAAGRQRARLGDLARD